MYSGCICKWSTPGRIDKCPSAPIIYTCRLEIDHRCVHAKLHTITWFRKCNGVGKVFGYSGSRLQVRKTIKQYDIWTFNCLIQLQSKLLQLLSKLLQLLCASSGKFRFSRSFWPSKWFLMYPCKQLSYDRVACLALLTRAWSSVIWALPSNEAPSERGSCS